VLLEGFHGFHEITTSRRLIAEALFFAICRFSSLVLLLTFMDGCQSIYFSLVTLQLLALYTVVQYYCRLPYTLLS
jgi:hypothetical protein